MFSPDNSLFCLNPSKINIVHFLQTRSGRGRKWKSTTSPPWSWPQGEDTASRFHGDARQSHKLNFSFLPCDSKIIYFRKVSKPLLLGKCGPGVRDPWSNRHLTHHHCNRGCCGRKVRTFLTDFDGNNEFF